MEKTSTLIDWFLAIQRKHLHSFLIFYVKDFSQSIKEILFKKKTLKLAESYTDISDEDTHIINHSRKFLLFNNHQAWMKKESRLFDITMGAYDGAEVCELIGSYQKDVSRL